MTPDNTSRIYSKTEVQDLITMVEKLWGAICYGSVGFSFLFTGYVLMIAYIMNNQYVILTGIIFMILFGAVCIIKYTLIRELDFGWFGRDNND